MAPSACSRMRVTLDSVMPLPTSTKPSGTARRTADTSKLLVGCPVAGPGDYQSVGQCATGGFLGHQADVGLAHGGGVLHQHVGQDADVGVERVAAAGGLVGLALHDALVGGHHAVMHVDPG